jgi:hypothetical protein
LNPLSFFFSFFELAPYFCYNELVEYYSAGSNIMNVIISFHTIGFLLSLLVPIAFAADGNPADASGDLNYAQVTYVKAVQSDDGSWCFHTTVRHNDGGWDHYANRWQVLDDHGNEIGLRTLLHPHDDEQPFTRSQCNIIIPPETKTVRVRARCTVHGYGGNEVVLDMSVAEGKKYKVIRTQ